MPGAGNAEMKRKSVFSRNAALMLNQHEKQASRQSAKINLRSGRYGHEHREKSM